MILVVSNLDPARAPVMVPTDFTLAVAIEFLGPLTVAAARSHSSVSLW